MKRIFSLLVACFMLVGVLSALAVTGVSAAEPTTYTLPMNWTTGIKSQNPSAALHSEAMGFNYAERADGLWKFAFYTDVDAGTAYTADSAMSVADVKGTNYSGAGKGPSPYIETANNRWIFVGTENYAKWYVNPTGRWTGTSIAGNNTDNYMKFSHNVEGYVPAVVFVAPKAGTYSFSAPVTGVTFTGANGDPATLTATVRKNGTVLASFSPTASNTTKTLTGEVTLQAGEELAFVFSQDENNFVADYGVADSKPVQFNLGTTVITEVSSSGSGSGSQQPVPPSPWTLPMNWSTGADVDANGWELASYYNGLWRLTSFEDLSDITTIRNAASTVQATEGLDPNANNTKTPQSYIETLSNRQKLVAGVTSYDRWYVNFGTRWQNKSFDYGDNSTYIKVLPGCVNGGSNGGVDENNNPTVVFTAPKAGTYSYTEFVKLVVTDATVEVTVRKNGTVLKTSTAVAAGETISGEVELAQGDLLMFAFTLKSTTAVTDSTPVLNISDVVVAEVTNTGSGSGTGTGGNQGGQGGSTVSPDTGAFSIAALVGTAVAAVVTGKVAITKRRRNG
ncbi:MAG: hypothetical protein E7648_07090 [Ruminococcaceae bacterium]|nr:hypothetical protein [Oscillospiraceae bacterium]